MKSITLNGDDVKSIDMAAAELEKTLQRGDVILSGPIPKNFSTRFLNLIVHVSIKVLKRITHSCIYVGDGKVLDIDYKLLKQGTAVELISVHEFVRRKIENFGGVTIYVVAPKHYTDKQRERVVNESINHFFKRRARLTHSYFGSLHLGIRYIFFKNKKYRENLHFRNSWTCGEMVAYILKKGGVSIGNRASYTFVPPMFLFSKNFRAKSKVSMN